MLHLGYNRLTRMEFKRTLSKIIYRIEPNPAGGFIARSVDPQVPPLEAPTKEELQQKILAAIQATLTAQFPGLKLPLNNKGLKYSFHIEAKPEGGFIAHSSDPNAPHIEGATHEEVQGHLAEKLASAVGSGFLPELSNALGEPVKSEDVKLFVNPRVSFTMSANSNTLRPDLPAFSDTVQTQDVKNEGVLNFANSAPIVPSEGGNWKLFRFLLGLLVLAGLLYFFLYRH